MSETTTTKHKRITNPDPDLIPEGFKLSKPYKITTTKKDGTQKVYTYYNYIPIKSAAGRPKTPNKTKLRGMIADLSEDECAKLLEYYEELKSV